MIQLPQKLKERFQEDMDFHVIQPAYLGVIPVWIAGYKTLVNIPETLILLETQAQRISNASEAVVPFLHGVGMAIKGIDMEQQAVKAILKGLLIIYHEPTGTCISVLPVPSTLSRAIEAPSTENVLRGSISSFNEDMDANIGMIRKHVACEDLQLKLFSLGKHKSVQLGIMYLSDVIDPNLVKQVVERIEGNLDKNVRNIQQLSKVMGFPNWSFVTKFNTTELPQNVTVALEEGKLVILLDRFPFALIIPSLLSDMFALEDDANFPIVFMLFLRVLRVAGILITVLIPGLYVALVSVNPEVLRIELALSIAKSRIDVPYPAFVETFLMLVILELILEASIRLPKSIGPTVTMVGGIILGEAIVSAKLVSNLLIIILSATTIASATVVGYQNSVSIRVLKYLVLILSSIYGIMGLVSGVVLIAAYLASLDTFGIPYFQLKRAKGDNRG